MNFIRTSYMLTVLAIGVGLLVGCNKSTNEERVMQVSVENIGREMSLEGIARNRVMGAVLQGEGFEVWIEGLEFLPEEMNGKNVRVSGTLGEANDLPVFVQKEGEPIQQGIPVPEGTDLQAASHRFILKGAKWGLKK